MAADFEDIRIRDLSFFDRVATLKSITAAARELPLPKATASRWLAGLEARIGQPLFKRTTRSLALTEAGKAFHQRVQEILAAVQTARLAAHTEVPGGLLRMSLPVPLGRLVAGAVIAEFRRRLPCVRLEIRLQNERVDLIRDGIDLAIRGGPLPDSDLVARRLSTASMWLYASARFRGESPALVPVIAAPGDEALLRRAGVALAAGPPAVLVDDRTAVADALVRGAGVGLLPSFLGEAPRIQGSLIRLSEDPVIGLPVHAVYHPSQRSDPRLLVLIDEVSRQLDRLI